MIDLINSGVEYNDELHTYYLNGKRLDGITKLIKKIKCPKMHDGIPQSILENAAVAGSAVHKSCQVADELNIIENDEAEWYKNTQEKYGYIPVANEYTVTDGEHWASNIDCVWADNDFNVILCDIKTTYELHMDYLSWQLSTYAYLFEKQNPHLKVSELYVILLFKQGKSNKYNERKFKRVERKTDEEVEELLSHYDYDDEAPIFTDLPAAAEASMPELNEQIQALAEFERQAKEIAAKRDELVGRIKDEMESRGITKFDTEYISFTLVAGSTSTQFDSARFKKENPELAEQYMKKVRRSSSLRVTLK